MLHNNYQNKKNITHYDYAIPENILLASEEERIAYLWSYTNTEGKNPKIDSLKLFEIIDSLNNEYKCIILKYFSIKLFSLPKTIHTELKTYVQKTIDTQNSFDQGLKSREPKNANTRQLFRLPLEDLISIRLL